MDCYITNNGNTLHLLLAIKAGLMLFFTSERQKKNNNNNILNPLLRPPLSNKPSFSVEESFNNKPPSLLTPIPPLPLFLFFINKRLYQSMTTVKLCVDRSIQDGLFSNWKFGFIFDHGPLDLQPSCTWAFSLGFFFFVGN